MIAYIVMASLATLITYLAEKFKAKNSNGLYKVAMFIVFLVLTMVSAIRFNVGTDYTHTYMPTYYDVLYGVANIRFDIIPLLILKAVVSLGLSAQWFFVATSIFINAVIVKTIMDQSKNKALSIFLYITGQLYFFGMNGIRQCMAIALFYYSLKYIEQKNFKKYLLINLIGAACHLSAMLFVPLFFVLNRKIKKKTILVLVCLSYLSLGLLTAIFKMVMLSTKYGIYVDGTTDYEAISTFNTAAILNFIILIILMIMKRRNEDVGRTYINLHFIATIASLFLITIPLANRLFISFRQIQILSVPEVMNNVSLKGKKALLAYVLVVGLYCAYFYIAVGIQNQNEVLPYKTILSEGF